MNFKNKYLLLPQKIENSLFNLKWIQLNSNCFKKKNNHCRIMIVFEKPCKSFINLMTNMIPRMKESRIIKLVVTTLFMSVKSYRIVMLPYKNLDGVIFQLFGSVKTSDIILTSLLKYKKVQNIILKLLMTK